MDILKIIPTKILDFFSNKIYQSVNTNVTIGRSQLIAITTTKKVSTA